MLILTRRYRTHAHVLDENWPPNYRFSMQMEFNTFVNRGGAYSLGSGIVSRIFPNYLEIRSYATDATISTCQDLKSCRRISRILSLGVE